MLKTTGNPTNVPLCCKNGDFANFVTVLISAAATVTLEYRRRDYRQPDNAPWQVSAVLTASNAVPLARDAEYRVSVTGNTGTISISKFGG